MTINRIWQAGWETGSAAEYDGSAQDAGGVQVLAEYARTGSYTVRCQYDWAQSFWADIPATRQIRAAFNVYPDHQFGNTTDPQILTVMDAAGPQLIEIKVKRSTSDFYLMVAGVQKDTTTDSPLSQDVHHHIGIDCKINSSSGWAYVYLNGKEILSFEGNTGNTDINRVRFGTIVSNGFSTSNWYFDDCYVDDTTDELTPVPLPILRFYWTNPNGNGNYDQWIGSDDNNIDNYLLVDERPPSGSDYVEEDTVDELDSYNVSSITLGTGQIIRAVIPIVLAQRFGTGERIALGTRYSDIDLIGSDQDPGSGAWKMLRERQATKPGGGDWDQSSINSVEAVVKSRGTF